MIQKIISNNMEKNSKQHHHLHSPNDFDALTLKLASPEKILEWSCGEVTKSETMNYRTQRSEKNGLFDERIFGPEKDYECYCGKYKGVRYKGIVCEKCGVEITRSIVRRDRMGHIELSTPVAHIWYLRSIPSRIGLVMGISGQDLEKVVYFAGYLITDVNQEEKMRILKDLDSEYKSKVKVLKDEKTKQAVKDLLVETKRDIESIQVGVVLDEVNYHKFSMKYSTVFKAEIGAEAVYQLLRKIDMSETVKTLEKQIETCSGIEKDKINKRLSLLKAMIKAHIRPEWMFLTRIPVTPPALRPMVALDGGRHATSDVNDLYRRVINRNNRLKKLKDIGAPEVILRNEKRILQEAVDALIDNSIRHGNQTMAGMAQAQKRPLKSLSDNLKGKRGLMRFNLLGKRVDYSGRSVIVVGPELKLHQCGLPKHMALELFRPFVIRDLLKRELAYNIRGAGKLIDEGVPEVWAILEEVIQGKYVLLNRAPTLHRLGIQAFQPVLTEGISIQVHPLVCAAYNADFDGDQMAVHVPLGEEAQTEAREIMASNKNILKPGNGDPTVSAKLLDIVLGTYWMTKIIEGDKGEGKIFESPSDAISAYDFGVVSMRAKIKVLPSEKQRYAKFDGKPFETSVGRILFNLVLPDDYPFVNEPIEKKKIQTLIDDLSEKYGTDRLTEILDKVKEFGFTYTTKSGVTWGIDDVIEPKSKEKIIEDAEKQTEEIISQYNEGLLSAEERYRKYIEIWHEAKIKIEKTMTEAFVKDGPIYDMVISGARGSLGNITQMAGIKGLIQNTLGETVEFAILSSYKRGLSPIEYFVTTHGSRKGLADTALNTSKAGYLTRRLFDVAQDIIIQEDDCGTRDSILIRKESDSGIDIPIYKKIRGRVLADDILDQDGNVVFKKGHLLTKNDAQKIESLSIAEVKVRSPLTCKSGRGICRHCYGMDLGRNKLVDVGEAVGTVAAQAIGEPGTQLTMRTFHAGGTASVGGDITAGLPRVEEIFEKRKPKSPAIISPSDGVISEIKKEGKELIIKILADEAPSKTKKDKEIELETSSRRTPLVKVGDKVKKGELITDGSADVDELFKISGREATQNYIIAEVNKIYELQGESVSRKHIEVIVRQMFSRVRIKESGDTEFTPGEVVEESRLNEVNKAVKTEGGEIAKASLVPMGITETSLTRSSFLSAASFQNTNRVLISSSLKGSTDDLRGLKENVIIGRLIPAGTGYVGSEKHKLIKDLQNKLDSAIEEPLE